jgi:hypothetical protein
VLHHRISLAKPGTAFVVWLRGVGILFLTAVLLCSTARPTSAKAPPIVSVVFDATVYTTPDFTSVPLGAISAGSEVELTGEAAPGFLAISFDDTVGWVQSQYLSFGVRPGIDTAETLVDTPLLEAPMPDAGVVTTVPQGETVILTGAHLDGYDAASHEGAGGWINDQDIAR